MELNQDWICGFVDGEGCFHVSITRHPEMTLGYQVLPEFTVVQHERDKQILYALKEFFKCGVVRVNHGDRWCFRVRKLSNLSAICAFFMKHPLKTKKNVDFIKFRKVVDLVKQGEHLKPEGFMHIVDIASSMNRGDREKLLLISSDQGIR